jgi:DNA-binding transcriptional LysR family regulator
MLDAPALVGFVLIAETGSVHAAAKRLNLSQAALSRRLQRLERAMRVQLFVRQGRRLLLSDAGARLLPDARSHLDGLMTALSAVSDDAQYGRPTVSFGCVPTVTRILLPQVVSSFLSRWPEARIKAFDLSAVEVPKLVAQSKADFGVGMLGINSAGLNEQLIGEDPMVLVMSRKRSLAGNRTTISWKMLAGQPLIAAGSSSGVRSLLENVRNALGITLNWQHEVQHLQTAIDWAAAGIAHAILPRLAMVDHATDHLRVLRLVDPPISRRMGVLTRPSEPLSPEADLMRRSIIARLKDKLNQAM